jgi:hypothetical protein
LLTPAGCVDMRHDRAISPGRSLTGPECQGRIRQRKRSWLLDVADGVDLGFQRGQLTADRVAQHFPGGFLNPGIDPHACPLFLRASRLWSQYAGAFVAVPEPQMLDQADEHGAHQECLVMVVAGIFDLQHHVLVQQCGEIGLTTVIAAACRSCSDG